MAKKSRVLIATMIGLISYRANDVIELDDKLAAQLEKQGVIDTNPAAVAYAIEQGAEVQKHVSPKKQTQQKNEQSSTETDQDNSQTGTETNQPVNDEITGTETNPAGSDDLAGTETNPPA